MADDKPVSLVAKQQLGIGMPDAQQRATAYVGQVAQQAHIRRVDIGVTQKGIESHHRRTPSCTTLLADGLNRRAYVLSERRPEAGCGLAEVFSFRRWSARWRRVEKGDSAMTKKITNPEILAIREAAETDPARARVWVGLDVGLKSTAVCVLDGDGKVVHQCSMKTHPTEIGRYLAKNFTSNVAVVGMETGAMSVHLSGGLRRLGYQVAVMDALQVHRVLSLKRNKTDTNDARGIAEITRTGRDYLTEVYVKSAACYEVRAQLIMRHRLVQQRTANENMIRGLLRVYGGRVEPGAKSAATYRERVIEQLLLIQDHEGINLRPRILPVLDLCERLQADAQRIEAELEALAAANPICRRFMAVPGVGAITALSFFTAVEEPSRFRRADDVAAYLGLTPRVYQSGESLTHGKISKMGNRLTRTHLVTAATVMLSATKTYSSLKDWGLRLAKKVGFNKAKVAVARKLAIILFGMWRDGTHFQFKADTVEPHRQMMQAARA